MEKNTTVPNVTDCKIKLLTIKENGKVINVAPITSTHAVKDENGISVEERFKELDSAVSDVIKKELENKVDKEEGKGLSERNFSTIEKDKLKNIEANANNYVHPNTSNIRHITDEQIDRYDAYEESKVDKVIGKDLSDQNYTLKEKEKVSGIEANANNYVHPTGDGNTHVPASGSTPNRVLKSTDRPGIYTWESIKWSDITGRPAAPVGIEITTWIAGTGEYSDIFYAVVKHSLDTRFLNVIAFGEDSIEKFVAVEPQSNDTIHIWADINEPMTVYLKQF